MAGVSRLIAVMAVLLVLSTGAAAVDVGELSNEATALFTDDVEEPVQELFFVVALPFILFFAIFIYLIRETSILGPPSDGVVAFVFAIFAVRGASPLLTEWFEKQGGVDGDLPFSDAVNALASMQMTEETAAVIAAAAGFLLLTYSRFYHERDDPFAIDLSAGIVGGVGVFTLLTGIHDAELFLIVTGVAVGAALVLQVVHSVAGFSGILFTATAAGVLWLIYTGFSGLILPSELPYLLIGGAVILLVLLLLSKLIGGGD